MDKVKSLAELKEIRDRVRPSLLVDALESQTSKTRVLVGMATCGIASGARETLDAIGAELATLGIQDVELVPVGCIGMCHSEPTVEVRIAGQAPVLYGPVDENRAREIVRTHLKNGEVLASAVLERAFETV